jgi:hypothetical protein
MFQLFYDVLCSLEPHCHFNFTNIAQDRSSVRKWTAYAAKLQLFPPGMIRRDFSENLVAIDPCFWGLKHHVFFRPCFEAGSDLIYAQFAT